MTTVEKYLFTPLFYPRSHLDVLKWWESRRLLYNGVVGGAGLLTLVLLAPVWLQIVHLLLADLVWITYVLLAANLLAAPAGQPESLKAGHAPLAA